MFNFFVKTSLNDRIELTNNPKHKFKYDYFKFDFSSKRELPCKK